MPNQNDNNPYRSPISADKPTSGNLTNALSLYVQLVGLFLGAASSFGLFVGLLMAVTTTWFVGLACGFISAALLAFGVPVVLVLARQKNGAETKG